MQKLCLYDANPETNQYISILYSLSLDKAVKLNDDSLEYQVISPPLHRTRYGQNKVQSLGPYFADFPFHVKLPPLARSFRTV